MQVLSRGSAALTSRSMHASSRSTTRGVAALLQGSSPPTTHGLAAFVQASSRPARRSVAALTLHQSHQRDPNNDTRARWFSSESDMRHLTVTLSNFYYHNRVITFSKMPPTTMSVRTMLEFWTAERDLQCKLIESANYLIKELPIRLSHRIEDVNNLPFTLACNPHLQKVYQIYLNSLDVLLEQPPINTFDENLVFTKLLRTLFEQHQDVVPALARALRDSKTHSPTKHRETLQTFLDKMLVRRISTRMIVGQHLASMDMHPLLENESNSLSEQTVIGLIERLCRPAEVVEHCGEAARAVCVECYGESPKIVIEGHKNISFAYVRVHLEYILFEIIKNALRATIEAHHERIKELPAHCQDIECPDVVVVVSGSEDEISIKVSDKGGGIQSSRLQDIWAYGYTTAMPVATGSTPDEEERVGSPVQNKAAEERVPMHGFGFGLPLARIYAQYFGGDLQINSLVGYGTDVYLKINRLGRHMENIQI